MPREIERIFQDFDLVKNQYNELQNEAGSPTVNDIMRIVMNWQPVRLGAIFDLYNRYRSDTRIMLIGMNSIGTIVITDQLELVLPEND